MVNRVSPRGGGFSCCSWFAIAFISLFKVSHLLISGSARLDNLVRRKQAGYDLTRICVTQERSLGPEELSFVLRFLEQCFRLFGDDVHPTIVEEIGATE